MPLSKFTSAIVFGTLASFLTSPTFAAVVILEGTESAPAQPPASLSTPAVGSKDTPQASPPAAPPAPSRPAQDATIVPPPTTAPTLNATPTSTEPAVASGTTPDLASLSKITPANDAQFAIEMLPGQSVAIGTTVSFKVTSKKPGYVILMDMDATGHLVQLYPNTAALPRVSSTNGNYIKASGSLTIPLATDPFAGVRYVVSPPSGQAMVVGILSASPVQIVDLPDIPAEILGKPDMVLAYLSKRTNELRIPDQDNRLQQAKWSFDAKPYVIQ